MKALTLMSLKIGDKTHKASTDDKPVVVDISEKEFDRLEAMSAVRKPTANELKLAQVEDVEFVDETPAKKSAPAKKAETAKSGKSQAKAADAGTGDNKQDGGSDPDLNI